MRAGLCFSFLLAAQALHAQAPEGWDRRERLGEGVPVGQTYFGGGIWAADKDGPAFPLVDSLGYGNALTGGGITLELGQRRDGWRWGAQLMGWREDAQHQHLNLERWHLLKRTKGGFEFGLEKEPIVWGYGLNGGYLLGEASRPFARVRFTTPFGHLAIGKASLGSWKADLFLGQLEWDRKVGETVQDPLRRASLLANQGGGGIHSPYLSGFRVEARFGEVTEFYANYINLWGGTLNGESMTRGYGLSEYFTACFGLKDAMAEGGLDFKEPYPTNLEMKNQAQSASNSDVGVRVRIPPVERWIGAEDVRFYLTRGSKAVNVYYQRFFSNPLHYLAEDVREDLRELRTPSRTWNRSTRYAAPSPAVPNDTIGLLLRWSKLRVGLEYQDTTNPAQYITGGPGHRSFVHGTYVQGFYTYGDPLGAATGGEARTWTLHLQYGNASRVKGRSWIFVGDRLFRDDLPLWQAAHPGEVPTNNRRVGLQQDLEIALGRGLSFKLGAGWERQTAVQNLSGNGQTALRGWAELAWRSSR